LEQRREALVAGIRCCLNEHSVAQPFITTGSEARLGHTSRLRP
jgi:hypothetical protein